MQNVGELANVSADFCTSRPWWNELIQGLDSMDRYVDCIRTVSDELVLEVLSRHVARQHPNIEHEVRRLMKQLLMRIWEPGYFFSHSSHRDLIYKYRL